MALPDNPISRNEQYLASIAGQETELPDYPITREEQYLDYIANNGGGGLTPEQEAKFDKALVTPNTAPTEKEIVGVGTANEQIMFKVGEGLSIDGSASPFTLKASGGGGGWDAGVVIEHPSSGIETYTVKLYKNTSQKLACVMGRIKFSTAVPTSGKEIANAVMPHPLIATDGTVPIGCGMVSGNMFIIEIQGYNGDGFGGMYLTPVSQIASGTYVNIFGMYPYR